MKIDRAPLFAVLRKLAGSLTQSQVDGVEHLLGVWERFYSNYALSFLAYCLATTYHETARTMQPIEEYGHGKGHAYGQPAGPWHKVYDGRGDVQLTWLANYQKARKRLKEVFGLDISLDEKPELAMVPDTAAHILFLGCIEGWFTGKRLRDYLPADPVNARRIINGTDKASTIASYYRAILPALRAVAEPRAKIVPAPTVSPQPAPSAGFFVRVLRALYPRKAA